jgi:signal transduction histidine kinase
MTQSAGRRQLSLLDAILTISSDLDLAAMLRRIAEVAAQLVDARYAALGVLDVTRTRLSEFITVGIDEDGRRVIGNLPEGHGILGLLIVDAKPLRLPDLNVHPDSYGFPPGHPPMTSFLGVPIRVRDEVFGNLYLTDRMTGAEFTREDEELVVGLAAAAGVAIENTRLLSKVNDLAILEDRERIARDLHDTVIQRLFATGLSLQGTLRLVETDPPIAVQRIESAVDELDLTVKHIRSAIFGLETTRPFGHGLRDQVVSMLAEVARPLGFEPRVLFEGPVDGGVDRKIGTELLSTMREALSNVARHAKASNVDVSVMVGQDITLRVVDDGIGIPPDGAPSGNGMRNMTARATELGGSLLVAPRPGGGTLLEWRVPRT